MTSRFDLAVAYRVYPGISKRPAVFPTDKRALAEYAVRSFAQGLEGLRAKIWVILDGCPPEYEKIFRTAMGPESGHTLVFVPTPSLGNAATFQMQIELLLEQEDSPFVYFAEDDYAYRTGAIRAGLEFLKTEPQVDFVTLYDHPDYESLDLHRGRHETRAFGTHAWHTAASTCLTFLTTRRVLSETRSIFESYSRGNPDAALWLSLTKFKVFSPWTLLRHATRSWDFFSFYGRAWQHGWRQHLLRPKRRLWAPRPSLATHLESTGLVPGFPL